MDQLKQFWYAWCALFTELGEDEVPGRHDQALIGAFTVTAVLLLILFSL